MSNDRYPKICYQMLVKLDQRGFSTWATQIKQVLYNTGFGIVWITQEVGDINLFLNIFSTRIRDISFQNWYSNITTKSKLRSYCEFKSLLVPEKYLFCIPYFHKRRALSRLRCSDHPLRIETGRWSNIPPNERFCELCNAIALRMSITLS